MNVTPTSNETDVLPWVKYPSVDGSDYVVIPTTINLDYDY
jgi:hypothetical protein